MCLQSWGEEKDGAVEEEDGIGGTEKIVFHTWPSISAYNSLNFFQVRLLMALHM